ncbi:MULTISPECIES: AMP-binding protein [unclassified Streptomyces]|uniref:AMP-binding protein n=1 Tax=unclassified Streptomyces TaxID=2593676 RepID=UPI0003A2AC35|nr:AMP-binding protein [Streptomyces sp. BoleA5]
MVRPHGTHHGGVRRGRWGDPRLGLPYGERGLSRHDVAAASAARGALLADLLPNGAEPHVGVLLGNVPEFPLWLGAAAYAGAAVVGVDPTRRGVEPARDPAHTECAVLVTERAHLPSLRALRRPWHQPSDLYRCALEMRAARWRSTLDSDRTAEAALDTGVTCRPSAVRPGRS